VRWLCGPGGRDTAKRQGDPHSRKTVINMVENVLLQDIFTGENKMDYASGRTPFPIYFLMCWK